MIHSAGDKYSSQQIKTEFMHRVFRSIWMVFFGVFIAGGIFAAEPRITLSFDEDWKFQIGDVPGGERVSLADDLWQRISLPHTWNTESDPPPKNYYRGPGWYRKAFLMEEMWADQRVFIRFGAASLVAKVFLNGKQLGEHKGGFAAFCYELTPHLLSGRTNVLAVRVDNSRREDVIPLTGDFTIFGGLYRSVTLIVTPSINISPLDHASPGVFLTQENVSEDSADVQVETIVSNGGYHQRDVMLKVSVRDASGSLVASNSTVARVSSEMTQPVMQKISIVKPQLWNGVADPCLYTVRTEISVAGKLLDAVEQPLGLRTFAFEAGRGFVLNGKPQQIRGVNRHQDWARTGWAARPGQIETDIQLIREMGATGVRLAHYQHDDYFYSLCDRNGLVVWAELPLVNDLRGTPEFLDNAREQLTELIRQNLNHPSIVLWSIYNEISPKNTNDPVPLVRNLNQLAKTEDLSRPTVGALSGEGIAKLHRLGTVTDVLALNTYPGWYFGVPGDMGGVIDKWNTNYGSRGIIISEYGAGASVSQHQEDFSGRSGRAPADWHPEEWQSLVHEANYAAIRNRQSVFGSFAWNMFDFASADRSEGDAPGINDKGLVTRDRKIKKDAYFFYQANWTPNPMVHVTSERHVVRTKAEAVVKVYSNCSEVRLKLNGADYGAMEGGEQHVFSSKNIPLQIGDNRIEVTGSTADTNVQDICVWRYLPPPKPGEVLSIMERVADWQLAYPSAHPTTDWTQGAGYVGIMALAGVTKNPKYIAAMISMGESNRWALGPRTYFADDQCVGQTYCELFFKSQDERMIAPMRKQFDDILAHPREFPTLDFTQKGVGDVWSWCDSLFMAPPAWMRLWKATDDERYLNFAVTNWWRTSDYLYDKEEHLFYRDSKFFDRREPNGKKLFWSRGNGWVMAGLARVLQYLPATHLARKRFERQFKEMAGKVLLCQQADGLWRASLLDAESLPARESSGSAFFVYALAWGMNEGLLDRKQFEPAVIKGWDALVECVAADGKLTHVQPAGSAPKHFDPEATEVYGVGAFLLAGSEVCRLTESTGKPPASTNANTR